MSLIKARSRGINLADNFAFTGTITGAGGGKFNQYVFASESSQQTIDSSGSFTNLTNVAVTITPSATNSKILLMVTTQAYIDHDRGWWCNVDRNISGGASSQIYAEAAKSSYMNTDSGDKLYFSTDFVTPFLTSLTRPGTEVRSVAISLLAIHFCNAFKSFALHIDSGIFIFLPIKTCFSNSAFCFPNIANVSSEAPAISATTSA